MNSSRHIIYALALSLAAGGVFLACGSDSEGGDDDDDTPSDDAGPGGKQTLNIVYSPMYSAFEPGHTYQVPAIVEGLPPGLQWSANPSDAVEIQFDDQGALITMKKAGDVTITAKAPNGDYGTATLKVAEASAELYAIGERRYNQPNPAFVAADGGTGGLPVGIDPMASCTNCHGATSTLMVEHTPQQTAGYSDEELIQVFTNAKKPEGAPQRVTNLPAPAWQSLHKWTMNDEEKRGIVVYLRSLPPKPTVSSIDFGGLIRSLRDAGLLNFDRFRRDGGRPGNGDAGTGGNTNRDGSTASVTGIDSGT